MDNKNASVNNQDHPHQEGQQNNKATTQDATNQKRGDNNNQTMSSMKNESDEQRGEGRNIEQGTRNIE